MAQNRRRSWNIIQHCRRVNKVARRLALLRLRTLGDKLTEIKAEAMVDTLGERLGHLEIETLALDSY